MPDLTRLDSVRAVVDPDPDLFPMNAERLRVVITISEEAIDDDDLSQQVADGARLRVLEAIRERRRQREAEGGEDDT